MANNILSALFYLFSFYLSQDLSMTLAEGLIDNYSDELFNQLKGYEDMVSVGAAAGVTPSSHPISLEDAFPVSIITQFYYMNLLTYFILTAWCIDLAIDFVLSRPCIRVC
jgi:hypothetical protein